METIKTILGRQEVQEAITNSSREQSSANCRRCWGTKTRFRDRATGKFLRDITTRDLASTVVAEDCLCSRRRYARVQLSKIPPVFGKPKLSRLTARPELHPRQQAAIEFVQAHPSDSFLLLGRNQVGKSH